MAKLFKYSQELLKEVVASNIDTFGYITTNTAELFWNTKEVQTKVHWGMDYYDSILSKKKNENTDCLLTRDDIRTELYGTFINSLLNFNFTKNKVFLSYFNMGINRRVQRIFDDYIKSPVVKKTIPIDTVSQNENDFFLYDLKNSKAFTETELNHLKEILEDNLTEFTVYQQRTLDKYKRYLQRQQVKRQTKVEKYNYLNMYTYKSIAVLDPKTNEVMVTDDGITFSTDGLPNAPFSLKVGEEYKITIEKIKTVIDLSKPILISQPLNENSLW